MRSIASIVLGVLTTLFCVNQAAPEAMIKDINCSQIEDQLKSDQERRACIEKRIDALLPLVELSLTRSIKTNDELNKEIKRLQAVIEGPRRNVDQRFAALLVAKTKAYWSGGAHNVELDCSPLPPVPDGHVAYGFEIGAEFLTHPSFGMAIAGPIYSRGCAGPPYCDSGGEFCAHKSRSAGCYVNKDWLEWYLERAATWRLTVSTDTVCS